MALMTEVSGQARGNRLHFLDSHRDEKKSLLTSYGVLLTAFGVYTVLTYQASQCAEDKKSKFSLGDYLLLGFATHKITRILSHDRVTRPLRAPFTEEKPQPKEKAKKEVSKGSGIQKALGDLLTCQFCLGPWVAASLLLGFNVLPQYSRRIASIFAVVAGSDFLHLGYQSLKSPSDTL